MEKQMMVLRKKKSTATDSEISNVFNTSEQSFPSSGSSTSASSILSLLFSAPSPHSASPITVPNEYLSSLICFSNMDHTAFQTHVSPL
jgi:hypothetical protein